MFERGVSFVPGAAPAGRAWLNSPVAKTRSPTITWSQTTPLICTVGSAAADTVSTDGSTGAVSAPAGAPPPGTPARYAAATPNATAATRNRFGARTNRPSTYGARCRAPDIHVTRLASGAPTAAAHRQDTAWRPRSVTRRHRPSTGALGQVARSAK